MSVKIEKFVPRFRPAEENLIFLQKLKILRQRAVIPNGPSRTRAGDDPLAAQDLFARRQVLRTPQLVEDVQAIFDNDPAAHNLLEVLTYQGLWAISVHRFAHALYQKGVPFWPRLISQVSRFFTQIEIHPGATIGRRFFIDHGAGVVIGETATIGDDCVMFQGASLAGTGNQSGKRHPDIGNKVIVGAGAKVLGAITVGDNVRIGASAVVVKPVEPNSTVVGNPAWVVRRDGKRLNVLDHGALPDPVQKACAEMLVTIQQLQHRIEELERK